MLSKGLSEHLGRQNGTVAIYSSSKMYTTSSKEILRILTSESADTRTHFGCEINVAMKIIQELFLSRKGPDCHNPFQDFAKCAVDWRARVGFHAAKIASSIEIGNGQSVIYECQSYAR